MALAQATIWVQFQSTPLMRGATIPSILTVYRLMFQSTPLMRGATEMAEFKAQVEEVSIHAPHARGDSDAVFEVDVIAVSIHAPHARGDYIQIKFRIICLVSIHAPHARGDEQPLLHQRTRLMFQSTPLMRGATFCISTCCVMVYSVSIHAPHARGDYVYSFASSAYFVSIHAPHARGDSMVCIGHGGFLLVSIHAPHARGDLSYT